jgi:3D (Asp-Asp-Asp) domain-containing protein
LGFKGNPRLLVVGTRVEVHRWVMRVAGEIRYKGEDTDGGARRRQGLWDDFIGWPWPVEGDKVTTNINRPLRLEERGPAADGQESLLVRRARERHWKLEGATATAEAGATLPGLADAITGNPDDYKLLGFNGDPTRLRVGDKVDIMPLLDKAAGVSTVPQDLEEMARQRLPAEASPPAGLEKGEYLGMFRITVYNTAREWDHPAAPTRKVPGLDREYGTAFLKDIDMQGSGIDREGRLIQHTWANRRISGYKYLNTIRTASGEPVQPGWSVAVDKAFVPPGTWIYIDNVGWRKAVDTGGKIQQRKIDVYFAVPRKEAYALDKQEQRVWRAK